MCDLQFILQGYAQYNIFVFEGENQLTEANDETACKSTLEGTQLIFGQQHKVRKCQNEEEELKPTLGAVLVVDRGFDA